MSKRISLLAAALLIFSTAAFVVGQQTKTTTTVTKTIQNADGTYTVIEYPVGKETIVTLNPVTIPSAPGTATILRDDDGTRIKLNLTGLPTDLTTLNLYAVDAAGVATSLGPIMVNNGLGTFTTTTPLDKFMLIASPENTLTTYDPTTKVFFRSAVPEGFAVVPIARTGEGRGAAKGEKVSAAASPYSIAMLGVPTFPAKKETTVHVNFAESTKAGRTQIFITPNFRSSGRTRVKAKFHELTGVPQGAFLTLWAVGPDGSFTRLGSTTNTGHPNVATIDTDKNNTNVALSDFGLFLTTEPTATINVPSGPVLMRIIR